VVESELATSRALFRRWVYYTHQQAARRRLHDLLAQHREMWVKRLSFWAIYHESDPSAVIRMVGNRFPIRNIAADIQTWQTAFYDRVRLGVAQVQRSRNRERRATAIEWAMSRPRLRTLLEQVRADLEARVRVEQRLLLGGWRTDGKGDIPPAVLRVRRAEAYSAFERARRFALQLRNRPAAARVSVRMNAAIVRWLLTAILRGLPDPFASTLPTTAAYAGHIDMLVRDALAAARGL
jgi:hypothetical protein